MRTQYNNGDNINLLGNGCDGCNIVMVNDILCHETGCPDEWRDLEIECSECRFEFQPEDRDQTICDGCQHPNRIDEADAIKKMDKPKELKGGLACAYCHIPFAPKHIGQTCCDDSCATAYNNEHHRITHNLDNLHHAQQ